MAESQYTPVNFDLALMPDDVKSLGSLSKFKTVDDLARSYHTLQVKLGADKNDLFVIPKDGDMAEVYKRLGKPDKFEFPADLKTQLPDDYKTRLAETANKLHFTDTQWKELLYFTDRENVAAVAASGERQKQSKADADKLIRDAFGKSYDQHVNSARDALEMFGKGKLWEKLETLGLTADPELVGMLSDIGRMGGEARFINGGGGAGGGFAMSPTQAKAEINRLKGGADANFSKAFGDASHPQHKESVDRMQKLHQTAFPEG